MKSRRSNPCFLTNICRGTCATMVLGQRDQLWVKVFQNNSYLYPVCEVLRFRLFHPAKYQYLYQVLCYIAHTLAPHIPRSLAHVYITSQYASGCTILPCSTLA